MEAVGMEHQAAVGRWSPFPGGIAGNARLTALTGMLLLVLLFVEGMTLLALRYILAVHIFVGFLLIPPIALKLSSTSYRFAQYYTGHGGYRAAGPPHIILRLLAPLLVLSTAGLMGSGVMLMLVGPAQGGVWLHWHKVSFFAWFVLMTLHVMGHIERASGLTLQDLAQIGRMRSSAVAGALSRESLVAASVVLGIAIGVACLPLDVTWIHWITGIGR